MNITIFTVGTSVLWSSLIFLVFYLVRKTDILLEICSITGVITLYLFCLVRLLFPVEFPWTRVLGEEVFNQYYDLMSTEIRLIGRTVPFYKLFLLLWGVGALILFCRYLIRYARLAALFQLIPQENSEEIQEVFFDVGRKMKRLPEVKKTPIVSIPCCFGVLKRRILLPEKSYSKEKLRFILLHECTHLRCNDTGVSLLINLLCAFYWWNPVVYLLKKDLSQSMELRCDRMVVQQMGMNSRAKYLDVILSEYREADPKNALKKTNSQVSQLFERHTPFLIERFEQLQKKKVNSNVLGFILTVFLGGFTLVISYSFTLQPKYDCLVEDILDVPDAYEITISDVYLLACKDGSYLLFTPEGSQCIRPENVELLVESGVNIKNED